MNNSKIVNLRGNLSPLEEHFRHFDMGKAHWSTADYINYSTTKVSPHFLKQALIEDFKQRFKENNNVIIYIYGTQGSGKSLLEICIGLELGEIYKRPLNVKNIAFLMDRSGNWSLAPAFDVTYSYQPSGKWTSSHQMTINGKRDNFTLDDFHESGKSALLKQGQAKKIITEVQQVVSQWRDYAEHVGVNTDQRDEIQKTLRINRFE